MSWFILISYIFFVYGISVMFTQTAGPFNIFAKIRFTAQKISGNLGYIFRCMVCFPMICGLTFSLIDWFFVRSADFTPFNMILGGCSNGLWWLAALMDMCFSAGICHLIWNIDDYIDKSTPLITIEENEEDE